MDKVTIHSVGIWVNRATLNIFLQAMRLYSHQFVTTVYKAACDTSNTVNVLNCGKLYSNIHTVAGMKEIKEINTLQMMRTGWASEYSVVE